MDWTCDTVMLQKNVNFNSNKNGCLHVGLYVGFVEDKDLGRMSSNPLLPGSAVINVNHFHDLQTTIQ